jgi:hypothetical protein
VVPFGGEVGDRVADVEVAESRVDRADRVEDLADRRPGGRHAGGGDRRVRAVEPVEEVDALELGDAAPSLRLPVEAAHPAVEAAVGDAEVGGGQLDRV